MKSYLSKFGVLLLGAMFAVAACQDYDEDIRQVQSELTADITELSSKLDAAIADLEGKADKADLEAALEAIEEAEDAIGRLEAADTDLQNQINTALAEVQGHLETLYANDELLSNNLKDLAGKVTSNEAKIAAVETELAAVKAQVETLIAKVAANEEAIAALQQADKDLQAAIDAEEVAREKAIEDAKTALTAYVDAEIDKVEALIDAETKAREAADVKLREDFAKADADLKAELKVLIDANEDRIDALEDAVEALQELAEDLSADLTAAQEAIKAIQDKLATITEDVNAAIARVQSLVYVPEYSDHKATLDWAKIVVPRGSGTYQTILAKASDLKYLVKAENAESVAAAIAANPEVLDYVVKGVQTRAAAADLEIVKVVAEGEYIIVSVVAKNFDNVFYTDSEEGCYSAALVLSDDKNTRTTEFTNLVASEEYAEFSMELFVPGEDDALRMATKNEVINYLMVCNDYKTVKTAVMPVVGFVNVANPTDPATFYTVDYMTKELGYDVTVDTAITLVDTEKVNEHDGTLDVKPGPINIDPYFNIEGGNPVYDFHYSVKPDVSFDNVGKKSTVNYTFTCGDVVNSLTYEFELANAQVAINAEVNIDWTVALQESLINNGVQYGNPLVFEVKEFESVGGAVTNLWSALSQSKKDTKSYEKKDGAWVESSKIISNKTLTETQAVYQLAAKKYEWNNSYKVVFVTTNDELNVDYTTSIIVNLVGKPAVIDVPAVDVDLLLNGGESFFSADVDLFGASYNEIKKYLGYADETADKAAWTAAFANLVAQNVEPNVPKVNDKAGRASTLKELKQARLSILEHNSGRYEILRDEANVITYSAEAWFGVPFNFTVNANVVLPKVDLIYSEDYVKNIAFDPYAEAEAAIQNGVYSIIKSDLAKYFNVDAESLEGHDYTVNFEVLSPEGDEVSLAKNSTFVVDKGASTYCYLNSGVDLDWKNYTGLEVNVSATLLVNNLELETKTLKIVAVDPLTMTVADFEEPRLHRENTIVKVYDHVVITSSAEPEKKNILTIEDNNSFDQTVEYAKNTYGVDLKLILDPQGIYYFNNSGEKVYVGANKYKYENGVLTVYGDDSVVKSYYAEFTAVMTSRICKGEHRESFRITIKK